LNEDGEIISFMIPQMSCHLHRNLENEVYELWSLFVELKQ